MDLMASPASSKLAGNRNYTHNLRRRIVGNPEVTLDRPLAESWIGVGKSAYHHLSQSEITSDNACYRQLSGSKGKIQTE